MGRSLLKASASSSREEDKLTYRADLVSDTNPTLTKSFYFSIEGNIVPKPVTNCDFLVLSSVFYAMRHGHDLFIEGTVSTDLLVNIEEFQAVWTTWLPETYTPIQISAQHEMIGDAPTERNAVAACSGGVDATFSMIQHATGRAGRRNCNLAAAVLVHGFDLPITHHEAFSLARQRAQHITKELRVPLSVVRTNHRDSVVGDEHWENEFHASLVTALSLFSPLANYGIISIDRDYNNLAFPWGSNPITNAMLSANQFQIASDGGAATRPQKVSLISKHPGIADNIRVCWEGPLTGNNCGKCEKCLRTQLNFLVTGSPLPHHLGSTPSLLQLLRMRIKSRIQLQYLEQNVRHAAAQPDALVSARALRAIIVWHALRYRLSGHFLVRKTRRLLHKLIRRARRWKRQ